MAKIVEQLVVIRLSRLVRNTDDQSFEFPDDLAANVESFVTEVLGDPAVVVEVASEE